MIENIQSDVADFHEFKEQINLTDMEIIKLGNFFLDILCRFPSDMFEKIFEEGSNDGSYQGIAKLGFNHESIEAIRSNIVIEPASLPMLIEPIKWSETVYGGNILNKDLKQDLLTVSTYHGHKTENRNNLFKAINNMSSVKFGFNNSLINYLENEGSFLLVNDEKTKSEQLQINIQLNVAQIYSKVPFYLPLQADWRGRIYVQSFFANYQGSDLSL
jgi:DNA-directed RNA polymerase